MGEQSYAQSIGKKLARQNAEDLSMIHYAAKDFDFKDGRFESALGSVRGYLDRKDLDGLMAEIESDMVEEWKLSLALSVCQLADEGDKGAQMLIRRELHSKDQSSIGIFVCALEILEERMGKNYGEHFRRILDADSERSAKKLYRRAQIAHDGWLSDNGASPHTTSKGELFRKVWGALFG